jgi:hypothetical protein
MQVIMVSPGKAAAFAHFEAGSPSSAAASLVTDIGAITEQRLGSGEGLSHHRDAAAANRHDRDRREHRNEWVDEEHIAVRWVRRVPAQST